MQFKKNERFTWNGKQYEILYCDSCICLLKLSDSEERVPAYLVDLERDFISQKLVPISEEIQNVQQQLSVADLNANQLKTILYRMQFVKHFAFNVVSANEEKAVIESICEQSSFCKKPGASSVRRWTQYYLESQQDLLSLLDKRSRLVS